MEITNLLEFTNRTQLREWLEANHATAKECWVTMYRTKIPRTDCMPYLHVVEEALCFGWIDSTVKRLSDGRNAQRLSPRRRNSHWTELNKQRCADLEQRGLMTDAGREVLPKQKKRTIEVVAAVIFDAEGRIFATQRGYGEWKDWWEFPGGKIEAGETVRQALKREIREELDTEIEVGELMKTIDYAYPDFHLTMHCFKCRLTGSVTLREHEAAKWLAPKDLQTVRWLPADEDFVKEMCDFAKQS